MKCLLNNPLLKKWMCEMQSVFIMEIYKHMDDFIPRGHLRMYMYTNSLISRVCALTLNHNVSICKNY